MPNKIGGVLLAAGLSTRSGDLNKLLQPRQSGELNPGSPPLIRSAAQTLVESTVDKIVVVTGHQRQQIEQALHGLPVSFVDNTEYASGMASSIACGVRASAAMDAVVVALGDMPLVSAGVIETLIDAFKRNADQHFFVPTHGGQSGNPVLFAQAVFPAVLKLEGDAGARSLWSAPAALTTMVETTCPGVLRDFDTPAELKALQNQ